MIWELGTWDLPPETCDLRLGTFNLKLETWLLDLGARNCDLGQGAKAWDRELGPEAWELRCRT